MVKPTAAKTAKSKTRKSTAADVVQTPQGVEVKRPRKITPAKQIAQIHKDVRGWIAKVKDAHFFSVNGEVEAVETIQGDFGLNYCLVGRFAMLPNPDLTDGKRVIFEATRCYLPALYTDGFMQDNADVLQEVVRQSQNKNVLKLHRPETAIAISARFHILENSKSGAGYEYYLGDGTSTGTTPKLSAAAASLLGL